MCCVLRYIYYSTCDEETRLSTNVINVITHLHLSSFVKSATRSRSPCRLTSINLRHSGGGSCGLALSEWICFMSASYWIWISFIILFLILKVTLAYPLISSWYAEPIALVSLLLLLGRSKSAQFADFTGKTTPHCKRGEKLFASEKNVSFLVNNCSANHACIHCSESLFNCSLWLL